MSTNIAATTSSTPATVRTRVLGSGLTYWSVNNKPLIWCLQVAHQSPASVAAATEIHPVNFIRPAELVTSRAITHGTITLQIAETYNNKIWSVFNGLFPSAFGTSDSQGGPLNDLADVLNFMQQNLIDNGGNSTIALQRVIRVPGANAPSWDVTNYHGVIINDIREDETAATDSMANTLSIEVWYTYKTDTTVAVNNSSYLAALVDNPVVGFEV